MNFLNLGFGGIEAELWRLVFVMTRIGAALVAAPLFGAAGVSMQARVIAAGAIAALVCGWTGVQAPPALLTISGMVIVAQEAVIGLSLGFVLQLAFAAPAIAAEQIGGGMGMSLAASIDPMIGSSSPVLGHFFGVVLTLVFLGLGAHLNWIALIVRSYDTFPPGSPWFAAERLGQIVSFGSALFVTAAAIALPVTLVLLLVQLASAVIGRSAPSLNLFALGLPAGVLAGIAALIAALPLFSDRCADLSQMAVEQAAALVATAHPAPPAQPSRRYTRWVVGPGERGGRWPKTGSSARFAMGTRQ